MKRAEILKTAIEYVTKDRAATHGDVENSFAAIGKIWGVILGTDPIPAHTVTLMMAGLKIVRATHNPDHSDNWVDLAGYAACGGELAMALASLQASIQPELPGLVVGVDKWIGLHGLDKLEIAPGETVEFKNGDVSFHSTETNYSTKYMEIICPAEASHYRLVRK